MLRDIDRLAELRKEHLKDDLHFKGTIDSIQNRFAIWLSDNDRYWNTASKNKMLDYNGCEISWETYDGGFRFALVEAGEESPL